MTVVVSEQGIVVIAGQDRRSVVSMGTQGPAGPPGGTLNFVADGAVGGHRAVVLTAAGVRPVDLTVPAEALLIAGISNNAASSGDVVTVVSMDEMDEPTWSWTPGGVIYANAVGALTQTVPALSVIAVVGVAITATKILVRLQPPIFT